MADRWKERLRSYPGRSHGREEINFKITLETSFVMRSQQTTYLPSEVERVYTQKATEWATNSRNDILLGGLTTSR